MNQLLPITRWACCTVIIVTLILQVPRVLTLATEIIIAAQLSDKPDKPDDSDAVK